MRVVLWLGMGVSLAGLGVWGLGAAEPDGKATDTMPTGLAPLPKLYGLKEMPRVDAHMHIRKMDGIATMVKTMDEAGITISVNLSGSREFVKQADEIHKTWKGRILIAPGSYKTKDELWWSAADLDAFAKAGCAGLKVHSRYFRGVGSEANIAKFRQQGKLGLPVLGFHIADPPEGQWLKPDRQARIDEALKVIEACPKTTFIMAHGFWLMNKDKDLDALSQYFDRYPNLYVDLSSVYQWWNSPDPTTEKLRAFILKYQDRLLYGTDGNPDYSTKERLENSYRVLQERGQFERGFFAWKKKQKIPGLELPLEVLNRIYWWNAARTIPRVRKSLRDLGYKVDP